MIQISQRRVIMNIVFVGLSGALKMTRACDVRLVMFANVMVEGNRVQVINRYSSSRKLSSSNIEAAVPVEQYEIIKPKNTGKLLSIILFILSIVFEPFYLFRKNRQEHINIIHVYSGHYFDFLLYWIISRVIKAKVVYQYVEYRSAFPWRSLYHRLNSYLCDKKGPKLWDGVIAISSYLESSALAVNPKLHTIKIPPICDFSIFETVRGKIDINEPYILYCGSIGYMEVIELILASYRKSMISASHKLVLILGGGKKEVEDFASKNQDVIIKHNLSYNDLVLHYKKADALLIPLRDNIRDIARFPNKICEYLASRGVIVTTDVGEIKDYFKDGESAAIASEYSINSYASALDKISSGEYKLSVIKNNSYQVGLNYFDTKSISIRLLPYLSQF